MAKFKLNLDRFISFAGMAVVGGFLILFNTFVAPFVKRGKRNLGDNLSKHPA